MNVLDKLTNVTKMLIVSILNPATTWVFKLISYK